MTAGKQTGRRHGPPRRNVPHEGMQAPRPMSPSARITAYLDCWAYRDGPGFLTPRQWRQVWRMNERHGVSMRPDDGCKGWPTPKQVKPGRRHV